MDPDTAASSPHSDGGSSWIFKGLIAGAAAAAVAAGVGRFRRASRFRRHVVGIIPARFTSSRFPGKPLVPILGKPMIQRTWERAKLATTLDKLVVATDDDKIADCCRGFGADVIMTSESCRNGTERCNEALRKIDRRFDVVVNIQGDEPLIEPEIIDGIVKALQAAPDAVASTAATHLKPEDAADTNRVKCAVDNLGYAIYFSRGIIPYNKGMGFGMSSSHPIQTMLIFLLAEYIGTGKVNPRFPYLLHLGIQCYDAEFLKKYSELEPTPLQMEEDLEQLKILENGYKMKVIKVEHDAHGVDTPGDVKKIESVMRENNVA